MVAINHDHVYVEAASAWIDELAGDFDRKKLIFPEPAKSSNGRAEAAEDVIKALLEGIPYPMIYLLELQNGQLLVVEKGGRLEALLDFICDRIPVSKSTIGDERQFHSDRVFFSDLPSVIRRAILRSTIEMRIARYNTPVYMQLYFANYIANMSVAGEERIRRILYADRGMGVLRGIMQELGYDKKGLKYEYEVVVFLTYVYIFVYRIESGYKMTQYLMQEMMFSYLLTDKNRAQELVKLYNSIREQIKMYIDSGYRNGGAERFESRYKKLSPAYGHIIGLASAVEADGLWEEKVLDTSMMLCNAFINTRGLDKGIRDRIENCDMSNYGIEMLIEGIRKRIW